MAPLAPPDKAVALSLLHPNLRMDAALIVMVFVACIQSVVALLAILALRQETAEATLEKKLPCQTNSMMAQPKLVLLMKR